jgi:hypothetical protein
MVATPKKIPAQKQQLPGSEQKMDPRPVSDDPSYKATGKLKGKVTLITGVNGVAPGPIRTPLIAATFDPEKVSEHGKKVPLKRPGQPLKVAYCYLFLASAESSYMTGQILHPNGGSVVNG